MSFFRIVAFIVLVLDRTWAVRIRDLIVPKIFELGTEDHILLDCDFEYEPSEKYQLDIKWYFNNEPSPFIQWVPGQMSRPQLIDERWRGHVNLNHSVHADAFMRHRALLLTNPTLDLSGIYTCKVSTFLDEDIRQKKLTIYAPASSISFQQDRFRSGKEVNISCSVEGIYPLPQIKLTWGPYQLDDSEASVTPHEEEGTFNIVVHRVISHDDLPSETLLGCELSIPGTNYLVREESLYRHRGGRFSNPLSQVGSSSSSSSSSAPSISSASSTTTTFPVTKEKFMSKMVLFFIAASILRQI